MTTTPARTRAALALAPLLAALAVGAPAARAAAPPQVASVDRAPEDLPPPALFVAGTSAKPLAVANLDVAVRIVGHLAETRTTLVFSNPNDRRVAGDLYFPLPAGATVAGYALDVEGRLVDGVVVAKEEARRIFEAETRKGVDPGLVEWTQGNVFKTRVFPIPPRGTRTIQVTWVSELEVDARGAARFVLPLGFEKAVGKAHVRVEVVKAAAPPVVATGPAGLAFERADESWVAELSSAGKPLAKALSITLPDVARQPAQLERGEGGEVRFVVRDAPSIPAAGAPVAARAVRLVWDASMSRDKADHAREIGVVERWLRGLPAGARVDLRVLRNELGPSQAFTLPAQLPELVAALRGLAYDGGTRMGALGAALAPGADVVVVVTDGLHTFGEADVAPTGGAPVFVLTGAGARQNPAFLAALANPTGGAVIDLGRVDDAAAAGALGRPAFTYLGARVVRGLVDGLHPTGPTPLTGPLLLTGRLQSDEAELELSYGVGGKVTGTTRVVLRAAAASRGRMVERAWAQAALADMLAAPSPDDAAIAELGQRYGIVTPGTSLLVLENLGQYLEHGVRPPASWPELRAEYDKARSAQQQAVADARRSRLDEVYEAWQQEVAWWSASHEVAPGFRYREASGGKTAMADEEASGAVPPPPPSRPPAEPAPEMAASEDRRDTAEPKKKAKDEAGDGDAGPEAAIALKPWDPDTPYLRALKAAKADGRFAVYLAQRKEFGASPAFYLDCSDFFAKAGEGATGIQVLSNLAELELEEPALMRVLAHRLTQLEKYDDAILVFRAVKALRPDEPQSWRDLALALAKSAAKAPRDEKAARLGEAVKLLAEVVGRRWDRFDGIELISLWELNRWWTDARAAGVETFPLEARFERKLDVDVRIVMTWDADMTDMDLHVLEPTGEEAFYSHNRTTIGGAVSRDFTQGYGPEVYTLRKALHGTYQVKTKFFGSSAAQLIGAVTLQVDVYTNYGRSNEQRRSMTLRLTDRKEEFVVGEIEL